MCLGDIDDFKHVNDTYGHEVGDEVLRVVSDVIAGNVPSEGYVCRWGGEEILFVVPNTDTESCEKIAKSICQKIHECTFKENSRSFNISMTFGVYSVTPNENYDEGISKVDKLLYKGKNQGKTALYLNKSRQPCRKKSTAAIFMPILQRDILSCLQKGVPQDI